MLNPHHSAGRHPHGPLNLLKGTSSHGPPVQAHFLFSTPSELPLVTTPWSQLRFLNPKSEATASDQVVTRSMNVIGGQSPACATPVISNPWRW
jgi:hypothetical protein